MNTTNKTRTGSKRTARPRQGSGECRTWLRKYLLTGELPAASELRAPIVEAASIYHRLQADSRTPAEYARVCKLFLEE